MQEFIVILLRSMQKLLILLISTQKLIVLLRSAKLNVMLTSANLLLIYYSPQFVLYLMHHLHEMLKTSFLILQFQAQWFIIIQIMTSTISVYLCNLACTVHHTFVFDPHSTDFNYLIGTFSLDMKNQSHYSWLHNLF